MSSSSGSVKDNKNGVVRADAGWKQVDISSKSFMVQSKRFYLDLKQNNRGHFVKLAEVYI